MSFAHDVQFYLIMKIHEMSFFFRYSINKRILWNVPLHISGPISLLIVGTGTVLYCLPGIIARLHRTVTAFTRWLVCYWQIMEHSWSGVAYVLANHTPDMCHNVVTDVV